MTTTSLEHTTPPTHIPTWTLAAGGLGATLTALCAVAWPLGTYTLTLAAFGLAHVLSELRYVHGRFGSALHHRLVVALSALLTGVVLLRLARLFGWIGGVASTLELGLVFLLSVSVLPELARRSTRHVLAGVLISAGLLLGLAISPVHTLLALAIAHNLTPLGFLADALDGRARRVGLAIAALLFLGVPLLIATGAPFALLTQTTALAAPDASLLPAGLLHDHLGAYLPRSVHAEPWAMHAFSAVVFAQCMHYAAVIHVLPRLATRQDPTATARPSTAALGVALLAITGLFALFWADFRLARAVYGVAAALHAWVEVPLLMIALLGAIPRDSTAPGHT